jgi:hypothetical protein
VRLDHYDADIILNQNYGAEELRYRTEQNTKILLGTRYVMLRKEFMKYKGFKRIIPEFARNVLITLGGADPDNNTLKVLKALNLIESPLKVKVVVGAVNPHYELLAKESEGSKHKVEILKGVEDMAPLMEWADSAISAGGSTIWELAFMGVPALLYIVADNQERAVSCLVRDSIFMKVGRPSEINEIGASEIMTQLINDKAKRAAMVEKEQALVDARGLEGIFDVLMPRPLTILFLGGGLSKGLAEWLETQGERIVYTDEKEYGVELKPDSRYYNYRIYSERTCFVYLPEVPSTFIYPIYHGTEGLIRMYGAILTIAQKV